MRKILFLILATLIAMSLFAQIDTYPYSENFDGEWTGEPAAPAGWLVVNNDADGYTWTQDDTYLDPHSGDWVAHGMGSVDDYLITPALDFTGVETRLKWWDVVESASYANSYDVLVSTTDTALASFTDNLGTYECINTDWIQHTLDLSAYSGQTIYVAFHQTSSASSYWGFGIDDVLLEEVPTIGLLSVSEEPIDFGLVQDGATVDYALSLSNEGVADLSVSTVTTNAPFSTDFTEAITIAPGESADLMVYFSPTSVASFEESLTIDAGEAGSAAITLMGDSYPTDYLFNGFEEGIPDMWTLGGDMTLESSSYSAYEGEGYVSLGYGTTSGTLTSGLLSLDGTDFISFWAKTGYTAGSCTIQTSTDGENFTDLETLELTTDYQFYTIDLANLTSDGYVRFNATAYYLYLDNLYHPPISDVFPGSVSNPSPANGGFQIPTDVTLTWDFGTNTDTYDLYFGANSLPDTPVVSDATADASGSYMPATLDNTTVYYWQVIAKNAEGNRYEAAGPVWTFQTALPEGMTQIGASSETNQHLPIESYYGYTYSQTIYTEDQFVGIDDEIEISKVYYNYSKTSEEDYDSDDWTVYMSTTTQNELTDWLPIADFTQVYSDSVGFGALPAGEGWLEIELQTPFTYNPALDGNLVIAVDENHDGYTSSSDEFYSSMREDELNVSAYYYNDSTNPDPASPPPFGGRAQDFSSYYPNIRFEYETGTTPEAPAVFFSEYIEGSSNNKAMEIYNNSGATIDLTSFRINQSNNGGDWQYIHEFPAGSTLDNGEVWVIMTDQVDSELYAAADADEVLGYPSVVHYNGNDARALEYSADGETWVMLDVIGIPTSDAYWDVAGVTEATTEHTLVRKDAITMGNTDWAASAGTTADDSEWVVYDQDTFEYLGWHGQQQEDPGFISGTVTLAGAGDVTTATVTAGGISVNPEVDGSYMIELPAGTYSVVAAMEGYATATVTGVVVESAVVTENVDFALELSSEQAAPEDVSVNEITGTMSWFPPAGQGEDSWLQWCEEVNNDGIGMTGGGTFSVASRWDTENIAMYNGMTLSKISFYPNGTTGRSTFVLKVWVGDNAENLSMVMEQEVTPTMDQWNEIDLDNPVTIDATQELWFGYTVVGQLDGEFPAGTDAGPAVTGFGDMISMNGSTWDALSDLSPDLNYNWNIKGYVQNPTGRTMPMVVLEEKHFNNSKKSSVGDLAQANLKKASSAEKRTTREFLGYNVYLDGEVVAESISELNYQFAELTVGEDYVGAVSAIYDEGESDLIEVPFTFAGVLDVPTDLTVDANSGVVTWGEPGPGGPGGAILEEGFEAGTLPTGWMTIDNDGDGNDWVNTLEPDGFGFDAHTGEGAMTSASYINAGGALTPDNYLITPQLSLGSGAELTYWVAAQDAAWAAEYYEVKVSTSGTAVADFADVVFSETLSTDAWQEVTVDLSAYAGEDIYLAWNHTDVTDMFYMKIDDVAVTDADTRDFTGAYNVYKNGVLVGDAVTEQTFTLTALLVGSEYTVSVTAIHDAGESAAAELTFTFLGEEQILPVEDLAVNETSGELSWSEPALPIDYSDDFEAYTAGEYLAVVSDMWTTWAQNPGGNDDALISDAQANSGVNSVHVEGTSDLVLPLGNKTSGTYEFSMMMYLEPGNGGYYNIQHDQTPGVEWGAEFYFGDDGNGEYSAGYPEAQPFTHPTGEWFEVKNVIDLDAAEATFLVNDTEVASWDFGLTAQGEAGINQLGGINIYSGAITGQTPNFYFDDVNIFKVTDRPVLSYDVYLDDTLVGNTTETSFMLEDLINGEAYTAGVVAIFEGGESEMTEIDFTYNGTFSEDDLVLVTALNGNYPNPFNPTTTISFSLAEKANVDLKVYNAKGQVVKTLVAGEMEANNHTVVWNGSDNSGKAVSSGVYFYRLSTKGYSSTQKMMLIK